MQTFCKSMKQKTLCQPENNTNTRRKTKPKMNRSQGLASKVKMPQHLQAPFEALSEEQKASNIADHIKEKTGAILCDVEEHIQSFETHDATTRKELARKVRQLRDKERERELANI